MDILNVSTQVLLQAALQSSQYNVNILFGDPIEDRGTFYVLQLYFDNQMVK